MHTPEALEELLTLHYPSYHSKAHQNTAIDCKIMKSLNTARDYKIMKSLNTARDCKIMKSLQHGIQ